MATLEDRILGEKLEYYCSSSEDEDDSIAVTKPDDSAPPRPPSYAEGRTLNTGPKGVIQDWQRFKQLEHEQRKENERERMALAKKLSMSCTSHQDDEQEKEAQRKKEEAGEGLLEDDEFFQQYLIKRMQEMFTTTSKKTFGQLINLATSEDFLNAIDKEDKSVTVVIHIYDQLAPGCDAMNGSLLCLAQEYADVKFCKFLATDAGVTEQFKGKGLPALLIYKEGNLISSFVRLINEFGDDFYAVDVESFLIEHGILRDKSLVPSAIRSSNVNRCQDDDDSDYSLDD